MNSTGNSRPSRRAHLTQPCPNRVITGLNRTAPTQANSKKPGAGGLQNRGSQVRILSLLQNRSLDRIGAFFFLEPTEKDDFWPPAVGWQCQAEVRLGTLPEMVASQSVETNPTQQSSIPRASASPGGSAFGRRGPQSREVYSIMSMTREWLGKLSETDVYPLMKRLLEAKRFKHVRITHGNDELGQFQ